MNKASLYASRICEDKWLKHKQQLHQDRLRNMKPALDNKAPLQFSHLSDKKKKEHMNEERWSKIEYENRILLSKMREIMNKSTLDNINTLEPRSLNRAARQRQLEKIAQENLSILKRIQARQPFYDRREWDEHSQQHEQYLRQIAHFAATSSAAAAYQHADTFDGRSASAMAHYDHSSHSDASELSRPSVSAPSSEMKVAEPVRFPQLASPAKLASKSSAQLSRASSESSASAASSPSSLKKPVSFRSNATSHDDNGSSASSSSLSRSSSKAKLDANLSRSSSKVKIADDSSSSSSMSRSSSKAALPRSSSSKTLASSSSSSNLNRSNSKKTLNNNAPAPYRLLHQGGKRISDIYLIVSVKEKASKDEWLIQAYNAQTAEELESKVSLSHVHNLTNDVAAVLNAASDAERDEARVEHLLDIMKLEASKLVLPSV